MMERILSLGAILFSYLVGSIPFGLVIVRLSTGRDIRDVESGRTGGTNAMRAAGFWAGLATAILDLLKSATSVWLVRYLASHGFVSPSPWLEAVAPIAAILGHNYSIFLSEKDASGRLRLRGGAGGAPTAGGAFGLWPPSLLFIVPVAVLLLFGIGYASVATLSIGLVTLFVFAYRAWAGSSPWQFILYGVFAEILLAWALRPNIQRLINGTERLVGLRARKKNKPASSSAQDSG